MVKLNANIEMQGLAEEYSQVGRVICREFLEAETAQELFTHLERKRDWSVLLSEHDRVLELTSEARADVDNNDMQDLANRAYAAAKEGYAFHFESDRRVGSALRFQQNQIEPADKVGELEKYMNTTEVLDFFRRIISNGPVIKIDLLASRYRAGHFLGFHDDSLGANRPAAFVINLTPAWHAAWGGLLQFLDNDGNVVHTVVPKFNTICLFKVPQLHGVSFVAPFAHSARYAISGWLHT